MVRIEEELAIRPIISAAGPKSHSGAIVSERSGRGDGRRRDRLPQDGRASGSSRTSPRRDHRVALDCCLTHILASPRSITWPPNRSSEESASREGRLRRGSGRMSWTQVKFYTYWPKAVRKVRSWLQTWNVLSRCWQAWSGLPPLDFHALIDWVADGRPLNLYRRL